jgi:hypothetical protein
LSPISVPLTAAQFQGLTNPVEFRIYISTPATGQSLEFDNFTVTGTVTPVPEPAGILLIAAGAGWWVRRRRRA